MSSNPKSTGWSTSTTLDCLISWSMPPAVAFALSPKFDHFWSSIFDSLFDVAPLSCAKVAPSFPVANFGVQSAKEFFHRSFVFLKTSRKARKQTGVWRNNNEHEHDDLNQCILK